MTMKKARPWNATILLAAPILPRIDKNPRQIFLVLKAKAHHGATARRSRNQSKNKSINLETQRKRRGFWGSVAEPKLSLRSNEHLASTSQSQKTSASSASSAFQGFMVLV